MTAIFGLLDDLARATSGMRGAPTHALPGAADDTARLLDDVTLELDDIAARGVDDVLDLANEGTELSIHVRGAGHDVRNALNPARMDPIDRVIRGVPALDEAVTGARSIADDVDDFVSRARTRVTDGARALDDMPITAYDDLAAPTAWQPTTVDRVDDFRDVAAWQAADDWLTPSYVDDFASPTGVGGFDDAFGWMG